MKTLSKILYMISFFCAVFGGFVFIMSMDISKNALQESSGSAISLAITIIPYCLARSFDGFLKSISE